MKYSTEQWELNENVNWKNNPFTVNVRKRGVHRTTVASIPTRMTIPLSEQKANAMLISAAPDMLEALKLMLSECYDTDRDDKIRYAVRQAKRAIAKAEGMVEK